MTATITKQVIQQKEAQKANKHMKICSISVELTKMRLNNKNIFLYTCRLAESRKVMMLRANGNVLLQWDCESCGF